MCLPSGTIEQRILHLNDLVATAERRWEELESKLCGGAGHGRETERQRDLWDRRAKMLRKMRVGLEQMSECLAAFLQKYSKDILNKTSKKISLKRKKKYS